MGTEVQYLNTYRVLGIWWRTDSCSRPKTFTTTRYYISSTSYSHLKLRYFYILLNHSWKILHMFLIYFGYTHSPVPSNPSIISCPFVFFPSLKMTHWMSLVPLKCKRYKVRNLSVTFPPPKNWLSLSLYQHPSPSSSSSLKVGPHDPLLYLPWNFDIMIWQLQYYAGLV